MVENQVGSAIGSCTVGAGRVHGHEHKEEEAELHGGEGATSWPTLAIQHSARFSSLIGCLQPAEQRHISGPGWLFEGSLMGSRRAGEQALGRGGGKEEEQESQEKRRGRRSGFAGAWWQTVVGHRAPYGRQMRLWVSRSCNVALGFGEHP